MKSKYFCFFSAMVCAMMLFAASCEKMNLGEKGRHAENDEESNVTVRVSSFEQVPFTSMTRAAVSDVCRTLNFIVFNTDGERVDQKNQDYGEEGFGESHFALPIGTYRLVVVAHSSDGNPSVIKRTEKKNESVSFSNAKGYTDTFFASQDLTVGDSAISLNINLKRIVAKVRFINEDAVPEKADSIRFYYEGGSGSLDALTGHGNVASKQITWFDKGSTPFEIFTIPRENSECLEVTVGAYQGTNILSSIVIDSIPIRRNHITTCWGRLFDGKVTKMSVTITVDDEWNDSIDFNF